MARLQYFFDTISIAKKFVMHVNKQHLASKMQCYCSSKAAPDFLKYSQEDIKGLDRKTLQLICKAIGISRGIKTAAMIDRIAKHMDEQSLTELSFFPFQNESKLYQKMSSDMDPLSITLSSEKVCGLDRVYEGKFPSVTTVLSATKSKKNLEQLARWRTKELGSMGLKNFIKMEQETFDSGTRLHEVMAQWLNDYHKYEQTKAKEFKQNCSLFRRKEDRLTDRENFIIKTLQKFMSPSGVGISRTYNQMVSLIQVLKDIDQVLAIESCTVHNELMYAGTVDCLAVFRDAVCLIDWKTTKRPRRSVGSCYDYPVQLAAYVAAINADPVYNFKVENAVLVFCHNNGTVADVHMFSIEKLLPFYYEWQGRLQLFKRNFYGTTNPPQSDLCSTKEKTECFSQDDYDDPNNLNVGNFSIR